VIYLDHNATTPLLPSAREAALRALDTLGNPSSHHRAGRAARALVEEAREKVAASIGARPSEVVFTSGGTEAVALGLVGAAQAARAAGGPARVVASRVEHACVLSALRRLVAEGFEGLMPAVDEHGRATPDALAPLLARGAAVVALASANNETGVRNDVRALAALARERGALFFCDAVQSWGKEPLEVGSLGVDLLAISAHKAGGPKGAGALYVRAGTRLSPLLAGTQESERRGGTENVPGIAGMGAAAERIFDRLAQMPRVARLRDRLLERLRAALPDLRVHGDPAGGLANTLDVRVPGVDGDALRIALDLEGICVSGGSACASGAMRPSHVLTAIGLSEEEARGAVRFSLGPETTPADVDAAAEATARLARRIRGG
jgi:cysteine desulfurase